MIGKHGHRLAAVRGFVSQIIASVSARARRSQVSDYKDHHNLIATPISIAKFLELELSPSFDIGFWSHVPPDSHFQP